MTMRDIRFRAWDKKNQRMATGGFWVGSDYGMAFTVSGSVSLDELNAGKAFIEQAPEFELMQYTGLKDKNGKEIYEGDIIRGTKFNYSPVFDDSEYVDAVVEWSKDTPRFLPHMLSSSPIEVIGNIYENPELLKS